MRDFFPNKTFKNEEILSALEWYFESKNLHLTEALKITAPLSTDSLKKLRINYSYYFISLMSAIEILLDKNYPYHKKFHSSFIKAFVFDKFDNGESNYNYLRELRNSIVHRGYDITCASHFKDNFPMLLAPESIPNRNGNEEYVAFGLYIIELIERIESIISDIIFEHVITVNLFTPTYTMEKQIELVLEFISKTKFIPEEVKKMAIDEIPKIDFSKINSDKLSNFEKVIKKKIFYSHTLE